MREVELGWGKVLLLKDNGEFHALGHKCPHYGAPLVKGEKAWGIHGRWDTTIYANIGIPAGPRVLICLWGLLGWGEVQQDPSPVGALESSLWA